MQKFSVLMSIYKNDKVNELRDALSSIINQTLQPSQIVIVIDGPIGNELEELVNEFRLKTGFISVIQMKENLGLGRALKTGLELCRYELVARMDSDDYSLPDRFEKQVAYFETHPDVDVLGGQIAEYDSEMKEQIAIRSVPLSKEEIQNGMKSRNTMNHVTVMYKKTAVLETGNYQHCPYFEDYYLWCKMIKAGFQLNNLDSVLVNVRTGDGMYLRRGGKEYNVAIMNFQRKILKLKFINRRRFVVNLCIRLCVANVPNGIRQAFYKKVLRKNNRE